MENLCGFKKIVVTGGAGFLGKHVVRELESRGVSSSSIYVPRRADCDLRIPENCHRALLGADLVIHLAASVGGIGYGLHHGGEFFYDNMAMGIHVIEAARQNKVKKIVVAGSVCSYPKHAPVPLREEDLWKGYPEETNAPYGIAKLAILEMLKSYRDQYGLNGVCLLPVNLYGPHDNFNIDRSHVIPAMIRKFSEAMAKGAEEVSFWGSGSATREFLYIEDAARAVVLALELYDGKEPINLGSGQEISIADLAGKIKDKIGFRGRVVWDPSQPAGQPRRMLSTSRAESLLGFRSQISLSEGLDRTIAWWRAGRHG